MFRENKHVSICLLCTIIFSLWYWYSSSFIFIRNDSIDQPIKRPLNTTFIHLNGNIKTIGNVKQMFVINLPYREDRRIGSIGLFQKLDFDAFIVPAYSIDSPEIRSRIHLTRKNSIRLVEIACWASHIQLWLEVASSPNDNTWILIFEDDIDLELSTYDILQSFPSHLWTSPDIIQLGYCGNAPGRLIYTGLQGYRLHQAKHPGCTHAYAIRSSSARKLLSFLSIPLKPIDDAIIDFVDDKQLLVYSIHPPLAIQQVNTSARRADVSPVRSRFMYQIKTWTNFIFDTWTGAEIGRQLKNSTLAQVNFVQANQWRIQHESQIWKRNLSQ